MTNEVLIEGLSMNNSKKIELKELTNFIQKIADMYFLAIRNNEEEMLSENTEHYNDYERFVFKVRNAFESLSREEKILINNEFFYQDYPNWWRKSYSPNRYYRMKRKSMLRFKEALDHEI